MSITGHKTNAIFLRYNITSDQEQRQAMLDRQKLQRKADRHLEPDKETSVQPTTRVQ